MFGGDAAATLAIDRTEPVYDPLRAIIETTELWDAMTPYTDEHGDVVAERNMPVVLPHTIRVTSDDEKETRRLPSQRPSVHHRPTSFR